MPPIWNKKGYAGWGNHVIITGRGIPFNGRWYGSSITCGWSWVGLHLLDPSSNNSLPISETIESWALNSCIWTTCSPSDDGESLYLYYGYGSGIRCYELTKYEK